MKTVPTIGGARGVFEIFVPGMFLLMNLILVLCLFPYGVGEAIKDRILKTISEPVLGLVIFVGFGYLIGAVLRMLRTESADKWSGRYRRWCVVRARICHIILGLRCTFRFDLREITELDRETISEELARKFGKILFRLDVSDFQDDLDDPDDQYVSGKLWRRFMENGIPISDSSKVEIQERGSKWLLTGNKNDEKYSIRKSRKSQGKLNVYVDGTIPSTSAKVENESWILRRKWKIVDQDNGKTYYVKRAIVRRDKLNVYEETDWLGKCRRVLGIVPRVLREIRNPRAIQGRRNFHLYAYETFPYTGHLKFMCEEEIPEALKFYEELWSGTRRRAFFNFCKTIVTSEDQQAGIEMYSAESLSRYISGMFYALVLSSFSILLNLILTCISTGKIGCIVNKPNVFLLIVLSAYLLCVREILKNLRFMRIKEVQTVFAASFRNRQIFK